VGKTSLVSRFVRSIYSEKYQTTVGVKIDKKLVQVGGEEVSLILWDLYGEDEFQKLRTSYLRGAAGYLLVVDGTRRETLEKALSLQERAAEAVGPVPFVVVLNKCDLTGQWEIDERAVEELKGRGWETVHGSAKTGEGVEEAFVTLAARMLAAG
jgi:small GTP-binding protein